MAPASVYLGIVHRLDRPTSGVILWAKTEKAARRLAMQFQNRRAVKEYWAIVESHVTLSAPARSIDLRSPPSRPPTRSGTTGSPAQINPGRSPQSTANTPACTTGRHPLSVTHAHPSHRLCLATALARDWPDPPVTHPGRAAGTPILGDTTYGASQRFPRPDRITLHARSLTLKHPTSGQADPAGPHPGLVDEIGIVLPE